MSPPTTNVVDKENGGNDAPLWCIDRCSDFDADADQNHRNKNIITTIHTTSNKENRSTNMYQESEEGEIKHEDIPNTSFGVAAAAGATATTSSMMKPRGRGRGRGSTLPAWMTQQQQQDFLTKNNVKSMMISQGNINVHRGKEVVEDGEISEVKIIQNTTTISTTTTTTKRKQEVDMENDIDIVRPSKIAKIDNDDGEMKKKGTTTTINHPESQQSTMTLELPNGIPPALVRGLINAVPNATATPISSGAVRSLQLIVKECAVCHEWYDKSFFTRNHWKGNDENKLRACKVCVESKRSNEIKMILNNTTTTSNNNEQAATKPKKKNKKEESMMTAGRTKFMAKTSSNITQDRAGIYGPADKENNLVEHMVKPSSLCSDRSTVPSSSNSQYTTVNNSSATKNAGINNPTTTTTGAPYFNMSNNYNQIEQTNNYPYESSYSTGALPQGWSEYFDTNHGQYYYHNIHTGATTWERPTNNNSY